MHKIKARITRIARIFFIGVKKYVRDVRVIRAYDVLYYVKVCILSLDSCDTREYLAFDGFEQGTTTG